MRMPPANWSLCPRQFPVPQGRDRLTIRGASCRTAHAISVPARSEQYRSHTATAVSALPPGPGDIGQASRLRLRPVHCIRATTRQTQVCFLIVYSAWLRSDGHPAGMRERPPWILDMPGKFGYRHRLCRRVAALGPKIRSGCRRCDSMCHPQPRAHRRGFAPGPRNDRFSSAWHRQRRQ